MTRQHALQDFSQDLHISHNQIFTYLNCSLKYKFRYVENRPRKRVSIALPFGVAIHSALEMYYRSLKDNGEPEPVDALVRHFNTSLDLDLGNIDVPVIYKKYMPDKQAALSMGEAMIKTFCEQSDIKPEQIVGVELPLSARLYTDEGQATDFMLVGIIDLLVQEDNGQLLIIDNKTAAKSISQSAADDDNQMSAYGYLACANQFIPKTADNRCRFDVLKKLKSPKMEQVYTTRSADDRRRFAKTTSAVLAGISANIFIPSRGWLCGDCEFADACRAW